MPSKEFTFAGFDFPRVIPEFHRSKYNTRTLKSGRVLSARMRFCYRAAPTPNAPGLSFYLDSDFMPGLRWQWCDDVDGVRIDHTGWWTDEFQDGKIRGIVFRLPRGRGFLGGWSMGHAMCSAIDPYIWDNERDAARAADNEAERVADREREYQEAWQAGNRAADAQRDAFDAASKAKALRMEARKARRAGVTQYPALCAVLRERIAALADIVRDKLAERDRLQSEWSGMDGFAAGFGD